MGLLGSRAMVWGRLTQGLRKRLASTRADVATSRQSGNALYSGVGKKERQQDLRHRAPLVPTDWLQAHQAWERAPFGRFPASSPGCITRGHCCSHSHSLQVTVLTGVSTHSPRGLQRRPFCCSTTCCCYGLPDPGEVFERPLSSCAKVPSMKPSP